MMNERQQKPKAETTNRHEMENKIDELTYGGTDIDEWPDRQADGRTGRRI